MYVILEWQCSDSNVVECSVSKKADKTDVVRPKRRLWEILDT